MENKMKLLLIEDDINTCEIFKKIERARKEIEFIKITNSETEGLKCVKQNTPEGIILDLELTNGEGSGFGFIKELRKLKLKAIPKIIVKQIYVQTQFMIIYMLIRLTSFFIKNKTAIQKKMS